MGEKKYHLICKNGGKEPIERVWKGGGETWKVIGRAMCVSRLAANQTCRFCSIHANLLLLGLFRATCSRRFPRQTRRHFCALEAFAVNLSITPLRLNRNRVPFIRCVLARAASVCVCVCWCVPLCLTTAAAWCHSFRLVAPAACGTVYEKKSGSFEGFGGSGGEQSCLCFTSI